MSYEYKVDIAGVSYWMDDIKSANIEQPLFDKLSAGNACSAQLTLSLWPRETIPRTAEIIPWIREIGTSDWYQLGVFYLDTREKNGDLMEITAYDGMIKSEVIWTPTAGFTFPATMRQVVVDIAYRMGVEIDPRCQLNDSYIVESQDAGYSMRDILRFIGAAHFGNWIMTNEGKLLLIPLFTSIPDETHYLVTEDGDAIVFGDTRILV